VDELAPTGTTIEKRLFTWNKIPWKEKANYKVFEKLNERIHYLIIVCINEV
jgi:hypothetical protein